MAATRSRRCRRSRGGSDRASMSALAAVRTWHRVISGFFPPQPLGLLGQEEVTQLRDEQVSLEGMVLAHFKVRQAEFGLLVLQTARDGPAGEGDMQEGLPTRLRAGAAEEVFLLGGIQGVACPNQPVRAERLARALQPEAARGFDFPHHGALLGVLDVETLPALAEERPCLPAQRIDRPCGR